MVKTSWWWWFVVVAGIPVVVLLALIPCVIALWLIRKRRRYPFP
jgi:hypothetical protein